MSETAINSRSLLVVGAAAVGLLAVSGMLRSPARARAPALAFAVAHHASTTARQHARRAMRATRDALAPRAGVPSPPARAVHDSARAGGCAATCSRQARGPCRRPASASATSLSPTSRRALRMVRSARARNRSRTPPAGHARPAHACARLCARPRAGCGHPLGQARREQARGLRQCDTWNQEHIPVGGQDRERLCQFPPLQTPRPPAPDHPCRDPLCTAPAARACVLALLKFARTTRAAVGPPRPALGGPESEHC